MSQRLDLKAIERRAWLSTFQDGLWDIFFGLMLVAGAVSDWLQSRGTPSSIRIPAYLSLFVLAGLVLWGGKRYITAPRLGRVAFSPARKARMRKLVLILFPSLIVTGALFVLSRGWLGQPAWWGDFGWLAGTITVTLLFITTFSLMAVLMDFPRLALYGVLFALPEILGVGLSRLTGSEAGFLIGSLFSASVVLVVGAVVMIRFLRDYPAPEQASPGGELPQSNG
jgi:hypothetical protein